MINFNYVTINDPSSNDGTYTLGINDTGAIVGATGGNGHGTPSIPLPKFHFYPASSSTGSGWQYGARYKRRRSNSRVVPNRRHWQYLTRFPL